VIEDRAGDIRRSYNSRVLVTAAAAGRRSMASGAQKVASNSNRSIWSLTLFAQQQLFLKLAGQGQELFGRLLALDFVEKLGQVGIVPGFGRG